MKKSLLSKEATVYTIGHSTHPWEEFLAMLQSFEIEVLADVRRLPGSRKFPQFDQEAMAPALAAAGIAYMHCTGLGGKRKGSKESRNTRWRNLSFRAYADYMETVNFKESLQALVAMALNKKLAYMCSEAVWWRCHRSMISDELKAEGWRVLHIIGMGKAQEHRFTAPAVVVNGHVRYSDDAGLFSGNAVEDL